MLTVSRLLLAGTVASVAGAAAAQSAFDSTVTLGYSNSSSDVGDYSSVSLGIANEIRLNNVTIDADIDFARLDPDDTSAELDLRRFALAPRYRFDNGLVLGAYFQRVTAELDDAGFLTGLDGDADSYGLILGYETENLTVEASIGETETDPDAPNTDITDFGVTADYDASDRLSVAGLLARTTVDAPGGDVDADAIGIAASYDVTEAFQVFGGYGNLDVSDSDADGDSIAIGVGYDLGGMGELPPVTVSLELARTTLDAGGQSEDIDTVRLGLSIPIGEGVSDVPLNSAASSFGGSDRTAVPSALFGGL